MNAEQAYLFRHALLRAAAYELQPPGERAALHRLALAILPEVLSDDALLPHSLELADHARAAMAGDAESPELQAAELHWLTRASDWFRQHYRVPELMASLSRVIDHPACTAATRVECLTEAAECHLSQMELPAAEARARAAEVQAQAVGDSRNVVRARICIVEAMVVSGRLEDIGFDPETLTTQAAGLDPELHVVALIARSRTLRDEAADELGKKALEVAQRHNVSKHLPRLLAAHARTLHRHGNTEDAIRLTQEALALAEAAGDKVAQASVLNNLGIICAESRRTSEAREHYRRAQRLCRETGERSLESSIAVNLANLNMYFFNDLPQAERDYRVSLQLALEGGAIEHQAAVCQRLGSLNMSLGRQRQAVRCLSDALHCARKVVSPGGVATAQIMLSLASEVFTPAERLALLVDGIALAQSIGHQRLAAEGLFRMTEFLNETGLLVAAGQCHDAVQALQDNAPLVQAMKTFTRGALARCHLLRGELDAALLIARDYNPALSDTMRHLRVGTGHAVIVAALAAKAVGPAGTRRPSADEVAAIADALDAMHSEFADSPPAHHTVINALAVADRTLELLGDAPPFPLLLGMPVEALKPTQLRGVLDWMAANDPTAHAALRNDNPELAARIDDLATPAWLPWDTPLASLPGLERVLPGSDKQSAPGSK